MAQAPNRAGVKMVQFLALKRLQPVKRQIADRMAEDVKSTAMVNHYYIYRLRASLFEASSRNQGQAIAVLYDWLVDGLAITFIARRAALAASASS
jgi:hypothetical protein